MGRGLHREIFKFRNPPKKPKREREKRFFGFGSKRRSGAAPARLCNRSIFYRANTQRVGHRHEQRLRVPPRPWLRLLSSPACFRYALLVFAAAVHENAAQHTPSRPARLAAYTCVCVCECMSVSECRWLCHVEPALVLLHAPVKCTCTIFRR